MWFNALAVTALSALSAVLLSTASLGQVYPARPIRVIAATSPGGLSDVFIRALGEDLLKRIGQPLVIENRPGGAFNIAARACSGAESDGYTICVLPAEPVTYNQYLFKNLGFDPENGLLPITNLFFITQALVVSSSLNVKDLPALAALSKAKPSTLSYSSAGYAQTLFIENFKKQSGADIVRLPFKGGGDAVTGVLTGTTPITFIGLGNLISHIRAGSAVALLADSAKRSALIPETQTATEYGYRGDLTRSYFGLFGPAGLSAGVAVKLRDEIAHVVEQPRFADIHLTQRGLVSAISSSPQAFADFLRQDRASAERVVRDSGLQAQ